MLLSDRATQVLREAIVTGVLEPGQMVKDRALAEQFGLSLAPVRQALATLAAQGLVETAPRSHTRVTAVRLDAVRDALAVVAAMHELAATEATALATHADVQAMRDANAQFRAAIEARDPDRALAADDRLHAVLLDRYGNAAAVATVARYTPTIRRLERRRFTTDGARESADRHDALIAAVADGDTTSAVALTRRIWSTL